MIRVMRRGDHYVCCLIVLLAAQLAPVVVHGQDARSAVTWQEVNRPPPPADARIFYGGDSLMFGDLRLPHGRGPHPVIIVIHGGCWRAAYDLNHISHLSEALRQRGIATWTLEYRRTENPGGGWPGTFQDVIAGSNHLYRLGETHHLDLNRVVVLGHSAGGHLALWLAAHRNRRVDHALFPPLRVPIQSVISLAGITDLRAYSLGSGSCNASVAPFLGGTVDQVPERYAEASPAELNSLDIPVLLVHGDADPYVPLAQARIFEKHARSHGGAVSMAVLPGAGHFEVIAPFSRVWSAVERLIEAVVAATHPES